MSSRFILPAINVADLIDKIDKGLYQTYYYKNSVPFGKTKESEEYSSKHAAPEADDQDAQYDEQSITEDEFVLTDLVEEAFHNAYDKGFWDDCKDKLGTWVEPSTAKITEKLALIHSEVSEALEDLRDGNLKTSKREDGKPEGFPSELADIAIRLFDLCGALDIDLYGEIRLKMDHNATRSHKHGKGF